VGFIALELGWLATSPTEKELCLLVIFKCWRRLAQKSGIWLENG